MESSRRFIIPTDPGRELETPEMSTPIQEDEVRERLLPLERPQYGTVPVNRAELTRKRYRIPFLILLSFEWAVVVFLSIIVCAEVLSTSVVIGIMFFYLLLGWVTRIVVAICTLLTSLYVPTKGYFYLTHSSLLDDPSKNIVKGILILLMLFICFAIPWVVTFFFEFKYLPAELALYEIATWNDWRPWLWPRALPMKRIVRVEPQLPLPNHTAPRCVTSETGQSQDFQTPTAGSPTEFVNISVNMPAIEEEPEVQPEIPPLSPEDLAYKMRGQDAGQTLQQFVASSDGWNLVKDENGVQCYSMQGQGRKIWKAMIEIELSIFKLWQFLYVEADRTPEWNNRCLFNETLHHIDEETDIVYTVSAGVGPVSSRDFVSVRYAFEDSNGWLYSAGCAVTSDLKPVQPGKTRGENHPGGYVLAPINDSRTRFYWVLNSDLKGWLPQAVVDQALSSTIIDNLLNLSTYLREHQDQFA